MDIEDIHEDREALARLTAKLEFFRRCRLDDGKQHSIGGTDDQMLARWRRALRIAKEGDAPERQRQERRSENDREPEQTHIHRNENGDERNAFTVNGNSQKRCLAPGRGSSSASCAQRKRAARKPPL